jgi:hypothetical protein
MTSGDVLPANRPAAPRSPFAGLANSRSAESNVQPAAPQAKRLTRAPPPRVSPRSRT